MFQIAICDDSIDDITIIKKMIRSFAEKEDLAVSFTEYRSGEELLRECLQGQGHGSLYFDLMFLDIFMGGQSGIAVAKELRRKNIETDIVFLTGSPDFALESYEVRAMSYLLKPINPGRMTAVMEQFIKQYRPRSIFLQGRLFVTQDIVYVESENKIVRFHFKDGTAAVIHEKLDQVEETLWGRNFLRCHQSFIANMDYVCQVKDAVFEMTEGSVVLIRKREFSQIRKVYFDYLLSN